MYLLVVYDVDTRRVNKVNKFLKMFLHWRQNSVFEGEVSRSQFNVIKNELKKLINEKTDSVLIYKFPNKKYISLHIIGQDKNPINLIL